MARRMGAAGPRVGPAEAAEERDAPATPVEPEAAGRSTNGQSGALSAAPDGPAAAPPGSMSAAVAEGVTPSPSPAPSPLVPPASQESRRRRGLRHLLGAGVPHTFQGRLSLAFVAVVALVLVLVGSLVVNRLDDYFLQQERQNLAARATAVANVVNPFAAEQSESSVVVSPDNRLNPAVRAFFTRNTILRDVANTVALADVSIRFGQLSVTPSGNRFIPVADPPFTASLTSQPGPNQARDSIATPPTVFVSPGSALVPWAVEVTLSNPYTSRASTIAAVTGLLAAVGIVALFFAVIVAALLAQRFTTPLRRLEEASRALAEGDLSQRVPASLETAGAVEIAELSRQFNAMADRLEESMRIIRRDRDRSREFLADVSHELRTPLAALRTFNELLLEQAGDDPEARAEFLESSAQQIGRLDWLAQNLLDLSKLDSGLLELDLRPEDLRATIESAVEQASAAASKRGVDLTVSLPDQPVRIRHDPQRIGQVASNLVANALKFTPRGGSVRVELSAVREGASLVVRDTGIGIDGSELPHIFERFYRGSLANEARGSGSGLGLAIARSIVDMHNGRITVESRPGQGSTFTVILPKDPRRGDRAAGTDSGA